MITTTLPDERSRRRPGWTAGAWLDAGDGARWALPAPAHAAAALADLGPRTVESFLIGADAFDPEDVGPGEMTLLAALLTINYALSIPEVLSLVPLDPTALDLEADRLELLRLIGETAELLRVRA